MKMLNQEKILAGFSIATAFGACTATLYLVAYWSTFGINVLQFVGLTDIVKLAIYPILVGSSGIFGGYFVGTVLGLMRQKSAALIVPANHEANDIQPVKTEPNTFSRWLDKNVTTGRFLAAFFVLVVGLFVYDRDPFWWVIIAAIVGFAAAMQIEEIQTIRNLIPNQNARNLFVFVPTIIVALAFGIAKQEALRILQGKDVRRISTKTLKGYGSETFKTRGLLENDETLKFIGTAGEYFFFLREDNTATYAFKYEDLVFFETWK